MDPPVVTSCRLRRRCAGAITLSITCRRQHLNVRPNCVPVRVPPFQSHSGSHTLVYSVGGKARSEVNGWHFAAIALAADTSELVTLIVVWFLPHARQHRVCQCKAARIDQEIRVPIQIEVSERSTMAAGLWGAVRIVRTEMCFVNPRQTAGADPVASLGISPAFNHSRSCSDHAGVPVPMNASGHPSSLMSPTTRPCITPRSGQNQKRAQKRRRDEHMRTMVFSCMCTGSTPKLEVFCSCATFGSWFRTA